MNQEIKYIANAVRWFDKINGNTYHSVKITRISDNAVLKSQPIVYGYGDCYKQTALDLMLKNSWIEEKYNEGRLIWSFERENNYPIFWNVSDGLKRDMKNNVA